MQEQHSALEFLRQQIKNLEVIHVEVMKAVNAVLAKEQFQKWKRNALVEIKEKVGESYAKSLSEHWLEGVFHGADLYDELDDDVQMCLRQLRRLAREIETKGLIPESKNDKTSS